MRKLMYILAGVILVLGLNSCEDKGGDPDAMGGMVKSAPVTYDPDGVMMDLEATPTCELEVLPAIIPPADGEKDRGGNRTCEAVDQWLGLGEDYFCGNKNDYDGSEFEHGWPDGLTVTVEGIYITFELDDCVAIEIDEEMTYWKVGAVIVKGSNAANIYHYPDGADYDCGLFAPGEKPMVSNLTFCFIPCGTPPPPPPAGIFAAKVWYTDSNGENPDWAVSRGGMDLYSTGWCDMLGFNEYPGVSPVALGSVGEITVNTSGDILITMGDGRLITDAYVFVGDEEDIVMSDNGCPDYDDTWVHHAPDATTDTFYATEF